VGPNQEAFEALLYETLLPDFCSDVRRGCEISGFDRASIKVTEHDAALFLKAWAHRLVTPIRPGLYRSSPGRPGEQLFWEGRKGTGVRRFTLWLEPIITIGSLARLHFEFDWPQHLIGTQSSDGAFDVFSHHPGCCGEHIAGEVKKTVREAERLLTLMCDFGRNPAAPEPPTGKERNAHKKIAALRARKAPIFWLIGPDGYSCVRRVTYAEDGAVCFEPGRIEDLQFPKGAAVPSGRGGRMTYREFERRVLADQFVASDGNHSLRLLRVAENLRDGLRSKPSDTHLSHLVSRIGILCRGLAGDIRSGHTPIEAAATLLEQLADLAEVNFEDGLE
jgi:hypothetical protein